MADKVIVCKDCGNEFVFSEGEQAFYKEKGFENDPVRCPECRKKKKMQKRNSGPRR
ncbi:MULTISPECIES: zinc-ribbon domain-containing protein [Clostridium]|uniref:Zinc-ribbon domain-containing protein n=1 Tax=Clostridium brassicae TaxID=2999072 RepID=A0ABT4D4A8_9CLOT|nr:MULTISPECIES: zinc-ribbon domain-containing protein [Clostridium]MCY6957116.1 zinc-ribbon domain-containing protein [Clostridium brassicae]WMJ79440.1 zinc-ribbon domain-containing protein [Clostridium sp. MB40-C1]